MRIAKELARLDKRKTVVLLCCLPDRSAEKVPEHSHDAIQRVMQMVNSAVLARICQLWCQKMDFPEETPGTLRGHKLLNVDGKTTRGSSGRGHKAIHVESGWDPQRGAAASQTAVDEKSNEITAIPKVLANLDLHGYIVTSDAMGPQIAIARHKNTAWLTVTIRPMTCILYAEWSAQMLM